MNYDSIDKEILRIIQKNGRITNASLADRVKISPPACLERVKKLEKNGVIEKYVALLNAAEIGYGTYTFVEVTLIRHGKETVEKFIKAVQKVNEIMECHHVTGEADFLLKIAVKDISAYEELVLRTLTALPAIQNLKTMVVLSTLKQETSFKI